MRLTKVLTLAAFIFLSGCGGGGGSSSSSSTPPTTYDLNAMAQAYYQATHNITLSASAGGNSYTFQGSLVPGSSASFGGITAQTIVVTANIYENGTLIGNDTQTDYFLLNPYKPLGIYDGTTGYVYVDTGQQVLPTAATVGETGTLDTGTIFYDTSLTTVYATYTETWTLNAGSSGNAAYCNNLSEITASGPITGSTCYTIGSNGNVLSVTITLTEGSVTLNFQ